MITLGGVQIGKREAPKRPPERRGTAAQRGYDARWQKRRAWYLRHHPVCAQCGRAAKVVDHIVPHRGDRELFNDETNWQPLCIRCHNVKSAKEGLRPWHQGGGVGFLDRESP